MDRNKKVNKMSIKELEMTKEKLETKIKHERMTKAKKNPEKVIWESDQTQSRHYKNVVQEIQRNKKKKNENDSKRNS